MDAAARASVGDARPSLRMAVVTCMDSRIDVFAVLGLHLGEAHVIRNAGGRVTDDVLRSLALSSHVLGVETVVVMQHTQCGLAGVTDELSQFAEVEVREGLATVTVVGHGLMEEPGTDALVFWEVNRTPVHLISQASDVSLSFLVDDANASDLVRRLHTALIELRDEQGRARIA